jgi:ATP-dependent DNA helicase RecG
VMRETTDGFEIARRDLEIRGPGEVLGTRQTGETQFHIADLERDKGLLGDVERLASELLRESPDSVAALMRRWMGDVQQYADV